MNLKLYDKLKEYAKSDFYPFHMPGHKRNLSGIMENAYQLDVTEIEGFDNMHDPKEIIRESMDDLKQIYQTRESFYLVNGSTCGILAAISAICHRGDILLMSRNCHKAVYHAVRLLELEPVYIPMQYNSEIDICGTIDYERLKSLLDTRSNIKAVVLTSPSYEGIVTDIKRVGLWIKPKNIPLIVDEAHGAHFPFYNCFPSSAIYEGADIVIQSLHKTLPSLTQTAILHVCSESVNLDNVKEYLSIYQTSSPSYLFMASMEYAVHYAAEKKEEWKNYWKRLQRYRKLISSLVHIELIDKKQMEKYGVYAYDPSKLVLSIKNKNMTGNELKHILLEKYHIELEMAERSYVIAMTSIMDTEEGFLRLYKALKDVDEQLQTVMEKNEIQIEHIKENRQTCIPAEALQRESEFIKLEESVGRISAAYIYLYPPGIPVLTPGEYVEKEIFLLIKRYQEQDLDLKGLIDGKLKVLKEFIVE